MITITIIIGLIQSRFLFDIEDVVTHPHYKKDVTSYIKDAKQEERSYNIYDFTLLKLKRRIDFEENIQIRPVRQFQIGFSVSP